MTDTHDNTSADPELPSEQDASDGPPATRRGLVPVPSARITAALAAGMLAVGVAVGAAIGPAPTASFAGVSRVLPALIADAEGHARAAQATAPAQEPTAEASTPRRHRRRKHHAAEAATEPSESAATEQTQPKTTKTEEPEKTKPLPPITKVWVILLSGAGYSEALESSAGAPFIDSHAIPSGTLLSGWSAIEARTFASDATLIATSEPGLEETIVQPLCPEGAAGAACQPGTPGALKTADEFLSQTLPKITSTPGYKSSGLVVVTFGSIAAGATSELPAGSTALTLTSKPPAGALLISPFVKADSRPKTTFSPTAPRRSLEALLHG